MITTAHTRTCDLLPGVSYHASHEGMPGDSVTVIVQMRGTPVARVTWEQSPTLIETIRFEQTAAVMSDDGPLINVALAIAGAMLTVDEMFAGEEGE